MPEYPVGQAQTYVPSALSVQVPLFKQGVLLQGVISQLVPLNPGGQAQVHVAGGPGFKTFTPPLLQTNGSHGVISQSVPEYPGIQVHVYVDPLSAQVPPF